jgi:hypothetical protein
MLALVNTQEHDYFFIPLCGTALTLELTPSIFDSCSRFAGLR